MTDNNDTERVITMEDCGNGGGVFMCGCEGRWVQVDGRDEWYDDACTQKTERTYVALDALRAAAPEGSSLGAVLDDLLETLGVQTTGKERS